MINGNLFPLRVLRDFYKFVYRDFELLFSIIHFDHNAIYRAKKDRSY